jgi:hypothetical protein
VHCILPQGQTTPEKTLSNPWFGKGFCEAHQYKGAIDRCEGGLKSIELFIEIYKERAKLEENHAAALRHWAVASNKQICHSKEFGTNKKVWLDVIRADEFIAKRHDETAKNIRTSVVEKMVTFKKDNYRRSLVHIVKIKGFEKDFTDVHKPWLELLEKTEKLKQAYYDVSNKLQQAEKALITIKSDVGFSEDQQKKAQSSVDTRKSDVNAHKTKYQKSIDEINKTKDSYEASMLAILKRTDDFERERTNHFKLLFKGLQETLANEEDPHNGHVFEAFKSAIAGHKSDDDIEHWNNNYGSGMKTKWPTFEECHS